MPETTAALVVSKKLFNRVDLLSTQGRIDANTASILDDAVKASIAAGRYRIVVDLSGTEYISSAGLKVLVGGLKEVKRHRGDVRLCGLTKNLKETFVMVGLVPELFQVFDDVLEAVGSF
jgi:anti-sigma B factor antagonist